MKILILNVGKTNKGNEALVSSTKIIIQKYLPGVEFFNIGSEKRNDLYIFPQPAKNPIKSPYPWLYLLECMIIKILRLFGLKCNISRKSKLFVFDDSDIIINSGGDQLSGEKIVGSSFLNILYAILLNKPIVLFGESLGYYRHLVNQIVGKYVFDNAKLILVREELSKEYLLNLGIDARKIFVTADPAFILPPAPTSRIDEILHLEGIQEMSGPIVGLNPSGMIVKFLTDPKKNEEYYVQLLVDVINYLTGTKKASILLIPHVYSSGSDDRKIISKIINNMSNQERIFHISQEYSAAELKGIVGLCAMFIGARMHATIAATSLCIPTIGIAYSHKMHGIIGKSLGLERFVIDINDLTSDNLRKTIDTLWNERTEIRKHLEMRIPEIINIAYSNGQILGQCLESNFSNENSS